MSPKTDATEAPKSRPPIPGWKKGLLAASLLVGFLGLGMMAFGGSGGDAAAPGASTPRVPGGSQLLPGSIPPSSGPGAATEEPAGESGVAEWGPPVARLGFSFFVGFAIAYALRAFFKITLIILGGIFLILFGLQYAGLIQIEWSALGTHYDSVADWFSRHAGSFKDFVTGNLPSAGSAVAGMALGFRRK